MKKLVVLATMLLFLSGCTSTNEGMETMAKIQEHYKAKENFTVNAQVLTSIYDKMGDFYISFEYDPESYDTVTVIKPESISGLEARISKFDDEIKINYVDVQLETLLAENLGINPSDVLTFAIHDLKNSVPYAISIDDILKITYENEKNSKQIFLNAETYDIMNIECFISGEMVLKLATD